MTKAYEQPAIVSASGSVGEQTIWESGSRELMLSSRGVGLEQLPTEILQQILYLIVPPRCECVEWTHGRRAYSLRSIPFSVPPILNLYLGVSLVSKALYSVARPIEYETVFLWNPRQFKTFARMLSNRTTDSRRGLGVDAQWVKQLVMHGFSSELSPETSMHIIITILTLCTKIHSIELPHLAISQELADTDDFKRLLLSLWNAMPGTLRNLAIYDERLITSMSPSDEKEFAGTHRNISMVCLGDWHSLVLDFARPLNLFPRLTHLNLLRTYDSHSQLFQNVDWSSLMWLRIQSIESIRCGWFWGLRYTALVSLELGDVDFNSRNASMIFSGAPNLEELRYHAYRNFSIVTVGWGMRNEETGLFVRHDKLRHIEVAFDQCEPPWGPIHQDLRLTHGMRTASLCDDFCGLTLKDFGSLNALDVFIRIPSDFMPEVHETLREELELNIGAAINSSIRLRVLVTDISQCVHH